MKTVKISALALAMAGVFATSAHAQSAKTNAWEGFYAEAAVGYAAFSPTVTGARLAPTGYPAGVTVPVATSTTDLNTATNKLGVGYNYGINDKFTLGLAASYAIGASSAAGGTFNAGTGPKWFNYQLKNIWSVTLNPGYVIDKDSLVYGKVGATGNTMGLNGQTANYQTNNFTGYVLGLGYKQMVTQSIYLLGEVNYASLSSKTATLATSSGPITANLGGSGYDFIVGLGYRF
ncbi:outer membrane protein [Polynucleobacter sp. MWH-UH35A]|uniref:outer membrane protein n=1 Tax=Polynucleobacter sp. MWH-UH35A TaxID=1855619 RepID=UPI001BFCFA6C|nr:outer membrane beta-barrel protein [Polynucleobacter sp. MWH-UH35A]QWD60951.1 outer membrane beta-barrel protein [Polynucleobacter sp. MWH-UH35A]